MALPLSGIRMLLRRAVVPSVTAQVLRPRLLQSVSRPLFTSARVARAEDDTTALATLKDTPKYTGWQGAARKGTNLIYVGLGLVGLGVAGGLLYGVGNALFSPSSEFKLQALALERMEKHPVVVAQVGVPMTSTVVQAARYQKENAEVDCVSFLSALVNDSSWGWRYR
jgi:hypothetical protein